MPAFSDVSNFLTFPITNCLKQDALSPLLFNSALEYAIRRVQVNQNGLKLNISFQFMLIMLIFQGKCEYCKEEHNCSSSCW
jgi:hypothetical protein